MGAQAHFGFGARLRHARERRNLTQEQLAELLDASVASINRWEREKSYPRADQRRHLCEVLGVSSAVLFAGQEPPREEPTDPADAPTTPASAPPPTSSDASSRVPADESPFWDVRPARLLDLADPLLKQGKAPVDGYFERPAFTEAREAVRGAHVDGRGGLAVFGPAMVGKTRLALEALRHEAPDFLLVPWPRHEFALAALAALRGRPVALLLDDLHELTNQHEAGRIAAAVRRLIALADGLIVLVTSRSGLDEAVTHQHYDGLIESLGLASISLRPMAKDGADGKGAPDDGEAARFLAFVRRLTARGPRRPLSLDAFDGTPGSVLLGLERRTTQLRSPRFPSAAKAILKALASLRAAGVYDYLESRVRRVAQEVFELGPAHWSDALDYLVGGGWVSLDEGDLRGESALHVPSDAYLDVCLPQSGVYPRSNRRMTSDFPKVGEALARAPTDSEALFALSRAIYYGRGDISTKWNELGLECALWGLAPLDPAREPVLWARGQYILGMSYWKRWQGDFAENARLAVAALEAAQSILTRETYPTDWAAIQRALGAVLADSPLEPRDDLLERAIACYKAALTVHSRAAAPYERGCLHNNLGTAYERRTRGNQAANIDRALVHLRRAVTTLTREAYPAQWALVMRNMGAVYARRINGDLDENERQAIACCRAVLDGGMRASYPYDWARTQHELGKIYHQRRGGERRTNLREAIAHYEAALEVLTPADYGPDREMVLGDLAQARVALAEDGAEGRDGERIGVGAAARDHPDAPECS